MCEHCHEEEYNAVILNLEDQDLECGVITIFEMDGQDSVSYTHLRARLRIL